MYVIFQVYRNDTLHRIMKNTGSPNTWTAKDIFLKISENDNLWALLLQFSQMRDLAPFAGRFIHVLLSYREDEVLESVHNHLLAWGILETLVSHLPKSPTVAIVKADWFLFESIIHTIASVCGASAYFSWEISLFTQRLATTDPIPSEEKAAMLSAQRRCRYDKELHDIFHESKQTGHNILQSVTKRIQWIHDREKDLRHVYLASADVLISPYVDGTSIITLGMASLRLVQVFLRLNVDVSMDMTSLHSLNILNSIGFTLLFDSLDPVSLIAAFDVFSLTITQNLRQLDGTTSQSTDQCLQSIIAKATATKNDSFVLMAAISTLLDISINASTHSLIISNGTALLSKLLSTVTHIHDDTKDSLFLVLATLTILYRITRNHEGLTSFLISSGRKDLIQLICQLALYGHIVYNQSIHPTLIFHSSINEITSEIFHHNDDPIRVQTMALYTIMAICQYKDICMTLLEGNIVIPAILEVLCQAYISSLPSSELTVRNSSASSSSLQYALLQYDFPLPLLKPCDERSMSFPYIQSSSMSGHIIDASIEILVYISGISSFHMYNAINNAYPLAVAILVNVWSAKMNSSVSNVSHMALIVLKRSMIQPNAIKSSGSSTTNRQSSSSAMKSSTPLDIDSNIVLKVLINTNQVYLLADIICLQNHPQGFDLKMAKAMISVAFDEDSQFLARVVACEGLRHVIHNNENIDALSFDSGIFTHVYGAIVSISSSQSHKLLEKLEILAISSSQATLLYSDIFAWKTSNILILSSSFISNLMQLLQSNDKIIQKCGIKILYTGMMKNSDMKTALVHGLSRSKISPILEQVISHSLQELRSSMVFDRLAISNRKRLCPHDIPAVDLLVYSLVIISYFFEDMKKPNNSNDSAIGSTSSGRVRSTSIQGTSSSKNVSNISGNGPLISNEEKKVLLVACEGLTEIIETRTTDIIKQKQSSLQQNHSNIECSQLFDTTLCELWKALVLLSEINICAAVLFQNGCITTIGYILQSIISYQSYRIGPLFSHILSIIPYYQNESDSMPSNAIDPSLSNRNEKDDYDEVFLISSIIQIYMNFCQTIDIQMIDCLLHDMKTIQSNYGTMKSSILGQLIDYSIHHSYRVLCDESLNNFDMMIGVSSLNHVYGILVILHRCIAVNNELMDIAITLNRLIDTFIDLIHRFNRLIIQNQGVLNQIETLSFDGGQTMSVMNNRIENIHMLLIEMLFVIVTNICRNIKGRNLVFASLESHMKELLLIPSQYMNCISLRLVSLNLHLLSHLAVEILSTDQLTLQSMRITLHNILATTVNICLQMSDVFLLDQSISVMIILFGNRECVLLLSEKQFASSIPRIFVKLLPVTMSSSNPNDSSQTQEISSSELDEGLRTKARSCYNCLRIIQQLLHDSQTSIGFFDMISINELIYHIMNVLVGSPRNMIWFPAMLRAAEILQVRWDFLSNDTMTI